MEREVINNAFYDDLGAKWYESYDHPIALLRAENKARIPWVAKKISQHFADKQCSIIDVGCGGGFLSNALAQHGHQVTGIDLSEESLEVARQRDVTNSVFYCPGDGYALPFAKEQFDVVCAMDFLEHIEDPLKAIEQAAHVLKPGGLFFFHTFNRNLLSYLIAIKGVEWFVPNTPKNMHLYKLFIKPQELNSYLQQHRFEVSEICGLMPELNKAFLRLIFTRRLTNGFSFKVGNSLYCGYMGFATKC